MYFKCIYIGVFYFTHQFETRPSDKAVCETQTRKTSDHWALRDTLEGIAVTSSLQRGKTKQRFWKFLYRSSMKHPKLARLWPHNTLVKWIWPMSRERRRPLNMCKKIKEYALHMVHTAWKHQVLQCLWCDRWRAQHANLANGQRSAVTKYLRYLGTTLNDKELKILKLNGQNMA